MPAWLAPLAAWLAATGWGDLVGFLGSVVGILGVPVAAWQAWRARSAAEQARLAAEINRTKVAVIDIVSRLGSISGRLETVERVDAEALRALAQAKRELIEVAEEGRILSDGQRQRIQATVIAFQEIEIVEGRVAEGRLDRDMVESWPKFIACRDELVSLAAQLRQKVTGADQ